MDNNNRLKSFEKPQNHSKFKFQEILIMFNEWQQHDNNNNNNNNSVDGLIFRYTMLKGV